MTHPVGATLVPVFFESDATHLMNFSGDGKVCPLYKALATLSLEFGIDQDLIGGYQ